MLGHITQRKSGKTVITRTAIFQHNLDENNKKLAFNHYTSVGDKFYAFFPTLNYKLESVLVFVLASA
jgi:hypothetical protein